MYYTVTSTLMAGIVGGLLKMEDFGVNGSISLYEEIAGCVHLDPMSGNIRFRFAGMVCCLTFRVLVGIKSNFIIIVPLKSKHKQKDHLLL